MTKRWVKKPKHAHDYVGEWEQWFPPCGKGCFLNDKSWEAYHNRQWAITSMVYPVDISEVKPND